MKGKLSDKDRLYHILDAIESIEQFTSGITYEEYQKDFKLRLALVKLIEIIGEASSTISNETQQRFTDVEWDVLNGIRNILVHEYFGIDYEIIWDAIRKNIPSLKEKIKSVLDAL
jgi:uncharacterized protein with HEPN domain